MEPKLLAARIRQLAAADRNAHDIYSDLAQLVEQPTLQAQLRQLAADEARHLRLDAELLKLLEKNNG